MFTSLLLGHCFRVGGGGWLHQGKRVVLSKREWGVECCGEYFRRKGEGGYRDLYLGEAKVL